jgi:division protein CdvB (Snf7/Vps24/ESCRT-III family)
MREKQNKMWGKKEENKQKKERQTKKTKINEKTAKKNQNRKKNTWESYSIFSMRFRVFVNIYIKESFTHSL